MAELMSEFVSDPARFGDRLKAIAASRMSMAERPDVRRSHIATFTLADSPMVPSHAGRRCRASRQRLQALSRRPRSSRQSSTSSTAGQLWRSCTHPIFSPRRLPVSRCSRSTCFPTLRSACRFSSGWATRPLGPNCFISSTSAWLCRRQRSRCRRCSRWRTHVTDGSELPYPPGIRPSGEADHSRGLQSSGQLFVLNRLLGELCRAKGSFGDVRAF